MSVARRVRNGVVGTVVSVVAGEQAGRDAVGALTDWDRRVDRWWHCASSALMSLLWAQALGWGTWRQVVCVGLGFTLGWLPDVDNTRRWRQLDGMVPDWVVGSPLRHHGVTHSMSIWAVLAGVAAWVGPWWLPFVPLQGFHHGLGDVLVGRAYDGEAGPPWVMWWGNWGFGVLRSGGPTCRALTVACWAATGWLLWAGGVS